MLPASLPPEAQAALEAQVALRPWSFAGCSAAPPSVAPLRRGAGGLAPQPVVLRLFLMHDGRSWQVMQGGLARVLRPGEPVTDALPAGAVFKDVWVMREDAGLIQGPEPGRQPPVAIRRTAVDMPSRVADDFYWLGRYVERLEQQARLGRAGLVRRARGAPLPRELAELVILLPLPGGRRRRGHRARHRCSRTRSASPCNRGVPWAPACRRRPG